MAQLAELAVPVVSTAAGFQRHLAGGQLREILQHPLTSECLADYYMPAPVDPVQLEDLLCYIQTDSCNRHAWTLRSSLRWRDCHRWLTMKPLNTGWVHPINESVLTAGPVPICATQTAGNLPQASPRRY